MWQTSTEEKGWVVSALGAKAVDANVVTRVAMPRTQPHFVYRCRISGMSPGAKVQYTLSFQGKQVANGRFVAPKNEAQAFTFLAVGDIGRGRPQQARLAFQMFRDPPDFALLLGDIAYPEGRISDYRRYFFPYENAETASSKEGAPLLRNILSVPVTGNHDTAFRNLNRFPDGLAYYPYWTTPLGPRMPLKMTGSPAALLALNDASQGVLDRLGNFSFSYGNSRWVVLDSNGYVNWRDPSLRGWLERELKASQTATWSFVAMHAPAFHSSKTHAEDVNMRAIADLFTKYKVDVVFAGHIHNYQRSFPLKTSGRKMFIDGAFDGLNKTRADGTIHVISGGGGAELYDQKQPQQPSTWQGYTAKFLAGHSYTRVEVRKRELILRQIDSEGRVIDQIRLTK